MSDPNSKILVCIDGSESSINAAWRAYDFAKSSNKNIIALHVLHIPFSISLTPVVWEKNREESLIQIKKWLNKLIEDAKQKNILIDIKVERTDSSVVEKILNIAESENVDIIFVGSTGKSAIKRLLIGSVASGVMTNAKCSVYLSR